MSGNLNDNKISYCRITPQGQACAYNASGYRLVAISCQSKLQNPADRDYIAGWTADTFTLIQPWAKRRMVFNTKGACIFRGAI